MGISGNSRVRPIRATSSMQLLPPFQKNYAFARREEELLEGRKKARKIEESSVLQVFQSSEFKQKTPFPSLEHLEMRLNCGLFQYPRIIDRGVDREIYAFIANGSLRISEEFYDMFLKKTVTLRTLEVHCYVS